MQGIGDRLRSRAAELRLSGAEVARRAGLTATRYGHYVSDYREPDLATLVRICRVLAMRPDELLAYDQSDGTQEILAEKRSRLTAFAEMMDAESLDLAISVMQALAATLDLRSSPAAFGGSDPSGKKKQFRSPKLRASRS